ncbi:hypothetical protein [Rhizosaccharibacter radicis]|uniref:Uncharacterized protein n=1 Tax=Rhizosaccharibacter radicis TaxID=2782605 RepID=A0ABT1VVA8_9PROT|nr:hypothetical protein [Acetobacteraceae bacterium KSS12]
MNCLLFNRSRVVGILRVDTPELRFCNPIALQMQDFLMLWLVFDLWRMFDNFILLLVHLWRDPSLFLNDVRLVTSEGRGDL